MFKFWSSCLHFVLGSFFRWKIIFWTMKDQITKIINKKYGSWVKLGWGREWKVSTQAELQWPSQKSSTKKISGNKQPFPKIMKKGFLSSDLHVPINRNPNQERIHPIPINHLNPLIPLSILLFLHQKP
ncbi:hypothetical protein AHAS_Ahas13G0330300 [Arachis hypogaea]